MRLQPYLEKPFVLVVGFHLRVLGLGIFCHR
jgi:hypothetical protein